MKLPIILFFSFMMAFAPAIRAQDITVIEGDKATIATQINILIDYDSKIWDVGNFVTGAPLKIPGEYGPGSIHGTDAAQFYFFKTASREISGEICAAFQVVKYFTVETVPSYRYLVGAVCAAPDGSLYNLEIKDVNEGPREEKYAPLPGQPI